MARRVLVLNQDYSPITVCTVYKGFLMVYLNKAEIIIAYDDYRLQSIESSYVAPAVIRISRYINVPFKGVLLNRHNLFRRDFNTCQYCGSKNDLTVDHVLPRSRGGRSTWSNLVTACKKCNNLKGDFTPEEANMPLLRKPFKPGFSIFLREMAGGYRPEWEPFLIRKSVEY